MPNATGQGGPAPSPLDLAKKSEETINYEISKTTKTEVVDGGRIKRVSVAVLVDGIYSKDTAGGIAYAPRAKEDIDRIAALVRSAMGFDQQRGDQIEVVNLRFAEGPALIEAGADQPWWASYMSFTKDDIMRMIELGILVILSLLVLLFVVRPLVRRAVSPDAEPKGPRRRSSRRRRAPCWPAASGEPLKLTMPRPEDNLTLQMLEVAQASGDIQQKSVERIGELVDRNPTETVSLIRTWLNEPATR